MVGVQERVCELQHAAEPLQPFRSNTALVHGGGKHVIALQNAPSNSRCSKHKH